MLLDILSNPHSLIYLSNHYIQSTWNKSEIIFFFNLVVLCRIGSGFKENWYKTATVDLSAYYKVKVRYWKKKCFLNVTVNIIPDYKVID